MLQVVLPGDTGHADVPLRPQEMDAAAHFIRHQGYSPEHFGFEPVGHSNSLAWPVPAAQISPEPEPKSAPESELEPVREPTAGLTVDLAAQPAWEPTVAPPEATEPAMGQESAATARPAPEAQAKPHTIVWKSFPKPRL